MLYNKTDSSTYIKLFQRKFTNFCEKSPILLSFITTANGVQVVNEGDDSIFDFPWKFDVDVKSFIFGIKRVLVDKCYPVITKIESIRNPLSEEEQLYLASTGINLDEVPTFKNTEVKTSYIIDRCIITKDTFIIKEVATEKLFLYRMNTSSIFFLKKIRNGDLNRESAGEYFFTHSELINDLIKDSED